MCRSLLLLGALLILASPALSDEVRLKNGSVFHGRIVREDKESITIDLGRGRMDIARRNIVTIVRAAPVESPPAPPSDVPPKPVKTIPIPDRSQQSEGGPNSRQPVVPPRGKRRERAAGPAPKIVPVDRTPPAPTPEPVGPEGTPRSDKGGGDTKASSSRKAPKSDW
jgi:hypothetical protein